jgi:hypothetical protein
MRYLSIINLNYFSNQINSKSYYFGKNNKPFSFINVQIRYFNKNINFQNKNQKDIKIKHPEKIVSSKHTANEKFHYGGIHGAKHQFIHRIKEKIGIKFVETTITKILPRLLQIKKRLGFLLIARKLARGVAIAIPAIGGIFATIVTFYDGKRTKREINQKNIYAALCFGIAT